MASTTIDKTTKINLGILGVLIMVTIGAASYLGRLDHTLESLGGQLRELKVSMDKNTAQMAADGKVIAVVQSQMSTLEKRIEKLEEKPK